MSVRTWAQVNSGVSNSVDLSSHSAGAASTLVNISAHLLEDSSASTFQGHSTSRDGVKERLRAVGEEYAISTVPYGQYPQWRCSESDALLIDLAARCSKAVYDSIKRPLVARHSSVEQVHLLQPSFDGSIKATAIYVVERMSLDGLITTIVVAIRGSKGLTDWIVNANNGSGQVANFIDVDAVSKFSNISIEPLSVHRGFLASAQAIAPQMLFQLREIVSGMENNAHIVFTGHSAGGAVSGLLCAHFLSKALADYNYIFLQEVRLSCITFGSPPIFTACLQPLLAVFPAAFPKPGLLLSIVNEGDPVPRMDDGYIPVLLNLLDTSSRLKVRLKPLTLYTLGTLVVLQDQNADRSTDEAPQDDLFAYELDHPQLGSRLFVNFFAHHMDEYTEVAQQIARGQFNSGQGLTEQVYPRFTVDL